jgi:hypothetical protein
VADSRPRAPQDFTCFDWLILSIILLVVCIGTYIVPIKRFLFIASKILLVLALWALGSRSRMLWSWKRKRRLSKFHVAGTK